ncbi:MAG: amidohydrolase, partial [Gammaproteobacteria bacterium]|nr:amidohydrolase [Gammaproteobacteria bacterium]
MVSSSPGRATRPSDRNCALRTRATLLVSALGACATLAMHMANAAEASLQDIAKLAGTDGSTSQIVIYPAREIVTLDPAHPGAQAVAVRGDRIFGVGSVDSLKAAAGQQHYNIDTTFANQVIVPGFIAQHDHPLLAA